MAAVLAEGPVDLAAVLAEGPVDLAAVLVEDLWWTWWKQFWRTWRLDPSSFVDRLDANQNGMLDPDEMQGPAQFHVSRMQRDDPSIRTDRPIPISKIKESFDRMRSGRSEDRGREEENRRESDEKVAEGMKAALLVPDLGRLTMP